MSDHRHASSRFRAALMPGPRTLWRRPQPEGCRPPRSPMVLRRTGGADPPAILMRNQTLQEDVMEFGTIEREIYVEASPEVVFEVVSSPDHLKEWWPDDARYEPTPGSTGEIVFGDRDAGGAVVPFTVVDARPPRTFSFRWTHPAGEVAAEGNSLLVTFDLTPSGGGTLLQDDRDRLPRDGLGGRRPRAAVPGARHRLGLLPAAAGAVRRDAARCGHEHRGRRARSTTTSGPRSATRPGAGCSTCCSSTATAPRPR